MENEPNENIFRELPILNIKWADYALIHGYMYSARPSKWPSLPAFGEGAANWIKLDLE